jgi:hypothetical protein
LGTIENGFAAPWAIEHNEREEVFHWSRLS